MSRYKKPVHNARVSGKWVLMEKVFEIGRSL